MTPFYEFIQADLQKMNVMHQSIHKSWCGLQNLNVEHIRTFEN